MTAERERGLLRTYSTSTDAKARQAAMSELWESHSKLVVAAARQFQRADLPMADLVSVGQLGLHAAIDGFEPAHADTRFAEYAVGRIRHYIQDYIARRTGSVGAVAPPAQQQLLRGAARLFEDARRACLREGIADTDAELCARVGARVGLTSDEVVRWLPLARDDTPLVRRLDTAALRRRMFELSDEILGARERTVFLGRCLAERRDVRQQDALASELGVTRERICELEGSAKRKIAAALARDGLLESPRGRAHRGARPVDLVTSTQ
jgi:RNA polymerase sigma factor (sigma-70 family)